MAKAVLIMDMPENCYKCQLSDTICPVFAKSGDTTDYYKQKPDWCPLIPEPERKEVTIQTQTTDGHTIPVENKRAEGWNACIDALEGKI